MRSDTTGGRTARRMQRGSRWVAAAAAGVLLAGGGSAAIAQDTHDVDVADDVFVPATVTVEAGDTVRWSQSGANPHTVTADDESFDSHPDCPGGPCMMMGDTFEQTFEEPGEYGYYCRIHGSPGTGMAGTVVVTAAADEPEAEPEDTEPAPESDAEDDAATEDDAEVAADAADDTREEALPETGAAVLWLALAGLLALVLGGAWLRRSAGPAG